MSKYKVGFVLPDFRGGGAERVTILLANQLKLKHDIDICIIVGLCNGPLKNMVHPDIAIFQLGSNSGFKNAFKLKKLSSKLHLTHLMGTLGMAHSVALSKLLGNKAKCISRIGNTISKDLERWSGFKKTLMLYYQNVLFFSDVVITQSKYMENDLCKTVPLLKRHANLHQIYNPVDLDGIKQKALWDITPTSIKNDFVTVGRLEWQKDVMTIIRGFALYHAKYTASKLHILGDGNCKVHLKNEVVNLGLSDSVLFHGFVENPYPFIRNCKSFIMASLYEGFSNAILEAICLESKVIVTDCPGGNKELIANGVNGILFPVGDYERLCYELENVESFKPQFSSVEQFSLENIAQLYLKTIMVGAQ